MESENQKQRIFGAGLASKIFTIVWISLGVAAFVYSLFCFGKSGSFVDKALGLLLSIFFGPLYFIYLYFYKSYCR